MTRAVRRALAAPLRIAAVAAAAVWSARVSTGRRKARRLAASPEADKARREAEARLRAIVRAYEERTPLTLRLLVIADHYVPGTPTWEWLSPSKPAFKVSCRMRLTAYYSSPLPPDETIARVLDAGDQPLSAVPFTRASARGPGPDELSHAGHTLTWDRPGSPVPEPEPSANAHRFVCEPPTAGVAGVRRRYGTVFALRLPPEDYYRIPR